MSQTLVGATGLILASGSQIRAQLLRQAGVCFEIIPSHVDEDLIKDRCLEAGMSPKAVGLELAKAKALDVSRRTSGLVLGADQILQIDRDLISKSGDFATAKALLLRLSAKTHYLHCAIAISEGANVIFSTVESVELTMRRFDADFIDKYLEAAGPEVLKSVGAYQMEGLGLNLFDHIRGDYFTVLGLPMFTLMKALRQYGVVAS